MSYNFQRTKMLGLPGLQVINDDNEFYIAENDRELSECNICHSNRLKYDCPHERKLLDVFKPAGTIKAITLQHNHKHFICPEKSCEKNKFQEKVIVFAEKNSKYTCRMEWFVFNAMLVYPAKDICRKLKSKEITEPTIKSIFERISKKMDSLIPKRWVIPKTVGFHYADAKGIKMLFVTNVEEETLIDVLTDAHEETIQKFASRFKDIEEIERIWVDMDPLLCDSVKKVFPKSKICVGRQQINSRLEGCVWSELKEKSGRKSRVLFNRVLSDPQQLTVSEQKLRKTIMQDYPLVSKLSDLKSAIDGAEDEEVLGLIDGFRASCDVLSSSLLLLFEDLDYFRSIIENTTQLSIRNAQNDNITTEYTDIIDAIIYDSLVNTRKSSADIVRARILYGEGGSGCNPRELVGKGTEDYYRFEDLYLTEYGTEETGAVETTGKRIRQEKINMSYRMLSLPMQRSSVIATYGQPLQEVHNRLKRFIEYYGINSRTGKWPEVISDSDWQ